MMFRHRRMHLFCVFDALLTVVALVVVQGVNTSTTHAATNQFRGVNWADPNDNFVTGNLVPVGLSTADSYATTCAKATAIPKGFQSWVVVCQHSLTHCLHLKWCNLCGRLIVVLAPTARSLSSVS